MKSGFKIMMFFYGSMIGVPLLLWIVSILSALDIFLTVRIVLGILIAIGSIIFGAAGIREVFIHGNR